MFSPHITSALAEQRRSRYRSDAEIRSARPRRHRRLFGRSAPEGGRS